VLTPRPMRAFAVSPPLPLRVILAGLPLARPVSSRPLSASCSADRQIRERIQGVTAINAPSRGRRYQFLVVVHSDSIRCTSRVRRGGAAHDDHSRAAEVRSAQLVDSYAPSCSLGRPHRLVNVSPTRSFSRRNSSRGARRARAEAPLALGARDRHHGMLHVSRRRFSRDLLAARRSGSGHAPHPGLVFGRRSGRAPDLLALAAVSLSFAGSTSSARRRRACSPRTPEHDRLGVGIDYALFIISAAAGADHGTN